MVVAGIFSNLVCRAKSNYQDKEEVVGVRSSRVRKRERTRE